MIQQLLGILSVAAMSALPCLGDVTFDLTTATLHLDEKGRGITLQFSDTTRWPTADQPAFALETEAGLQTPKSVERAGQRLTVRFDGGATAEFRTTCHDGFVLFELIKLSSDQPVKRFRLFRLPTPREGELAGTLNAFYLDGHVACVMAAEPNVHATTLQRGTYHSDRQGCTHQFEQTDEAKVGTYAARFTATSTRTDGIGWNVRGKTLSQPLDLSGCKAIRAWVKGDGKNEQLKIQLYDGAGGYRDNYIKIDFEGWRRMTLTDCPINTLRYNSVRNLNFYYNALPAGQTVNCLIDHVEAIVERDGRQQVILLEDFEDTDSALWGDPIRSLDVQTYQRYGLEPARFGILACKEADFLDTIQRFESVAGLPSPKPGGVWNKKSPWSKRSYFFLTRFDESQFDQAVAIARRGRFHTILILGSSWRKTTGHYEVNRKNFPDGLAGLQRTVRRFKEAGFNVGLHFLGASIYPPDSYLTPVPDRRLAKDAFIKLAADIDADADFIPTAASPKAFPSEDGGYRGKGTVLQIGDELISYGGLSTEPPYGFLHCRREHLGTRRAPHRKGETIAHLMRSYGYHMYDMDTSLLDEIATNFATVANACDIDMLYFDGSENLQGPHWYYNARLHKAFYDKLDNKNMLIQASSHSHYSWHIMARSASADGHGDLKGYLEERSGWFPVLARNHMPLDIGWYYGYDPNATPDMFEYVLGATIGYNASISFQVSTTAAAKHPFTGNILDLIAAYEGIRLSGRVPQAMRDRLRIDPALAGAKLPEQRAKLLDKRREYRLIGKPGHEAFQRVIYSPWHTVSPIDEQSNTWTVHVKDAPARVGIQIHAQGNGPWLKAGPAYHADNALLLEDFDDLASYARTPTKNAPRHRIDPGQGGSTLKGVTHQFVSTDQNARQGPRCAVYTATSSLPTANGWSVIGKSFDPPLDLAWHKAIGFWFHGDGNGGQFKLQLRDRSAAVDYYIKNDYTGWRYQQLPRPEKDPIDYRQVRQLLFYYNSLPAETTVACAIDDIKALPARDERTLQNPYLEIAGQRFVFDATLTAGQYLTAWPAESTTINGPPLEKPRDLLPTMKSITLPAGQHSVRFGCAGTLLLTPRVRITLQTPERHPLTR